MKNASTGNMPPLDQTDWPRVRTMSDTEIHHDADSPHTTEADWEGAVLRQGKVEVGRVKRRSPQKGPVKRSISIRLSPEVIEYFKAGGPGWQTRLDLVLREYVERQR